MKIKIRHLRFYIGLFLFLVIDISVLIFAENLVQKNMQMYELIGFSNSLGNLRMNFRKSLIENRDFLITDETKNLLDYHTSKEHVLQYLKEISTRYENQLKEESHLDEINRLVLENYAIMDSSIELHVSQKPFPEKIVNLTKESSQLNISLSNLLLVIEGNIMGMNQELMRDYTKQARWLSFFTIAVFFLGFLLILTSYIYLRKEIRMRYEVEKTVKNQAKKLEEVNKGRDVLFSIIAHDLRSYVGHITSYSKLLKDRLNNLNQGEIEKIVQVLNSSSQNTSDLLQNLLDWSKLEKGVLQGAPARYNIKNIIEKFGIYVIFTIKN
ncbi:MAG: hypothetical protein ACOCWM_06285, partial [Cyclobacteriaceae bacterium]